MMKRYKQLLTYIKVCGDPEVKIGPIFILDADLSYL